MTTALRAVAMALGLFAAAFAATGAHAQSADDFRRFLDALWPDAQKAGVSRTTFDKALRGVEPDLALPD
ncbi:MAG TPA: lytic murein transglycosylase, partial [Hyphomicrobiaceae bacterium]|nr:lytic murein transglycosylase [Hyphomicrobiaceae bacterium]